MSKKAAKKRKRQKQDGKGKTKKKGRGRIFDGQTNFVYYERRTPRQVDRESRCTSPSISWMDYERPSPKTRSHLLSTQYDREGRRTRTINVPHINILLGDVKLLSLPISRLHDTAFSARQILPTAKCMPSG